MTSLLNRWLAAGPGDAPEAQALGLPMCWLIYRATESGGLQRAPIEQRLQGGILGLVGPLPTTADMGRLAREIFAECSRRGYKGVLVDVDPGADSAQVSQLLTLLAQRALTCHVPMHLGGAVPPARMLIPSALSGGSYTEMLATARGRYGEHLGLELARMCHDFTMPAYPPQGTPLTAAQLRDIIEAHRPTPYFSAEMQCRYFTYQTPQGPHFVLFDDVAAARGKLALAAQAGLRDAFILYREWRENAAAFYSQ